MAAMWLLGNNLPELTPRAHNSWKKPALHIVANLIVFCMSPLAEEYVQTHGDGPINTHVHCTCLHEFSNTILQKEKTLLAICIFIVY